MVAESQEKCDYKMSELIRLLRYLGFAIAWDKLVSSTVSLTYLGIELDSVHMEFRLLKRSEPA